MIHRLVILLALLPAFGGIAPARAQQWTGSLKLGGAVTTFTGDLAAGNTTWDPRTGLAAGGSVGYNFGNGFIPQVEFTYIRQGASTDVDFDGVPSRIRSDLTYLQIPFLLQYRFDTGGYLHPRFFAGPMVAFQLDAHLTFRAAGSDVSLTDEDTSVKSRDYGAVAGAALEIEVADQRVSLEARYLFGMADITKPNEDGVDTTQQNRGLVFLIGVVF